MNGRDLLDKMELVDGKYLMAAEEPAVKKSHWGRMIAAAACLCLAVSAFLFGAEAKTYQEAVEFFDTYGLSAEGLSRQEIKAVYRDISTEKFTYGKTAQAIRNSRSLSVSGEQLPSDATSPKDLAALWAQMANLSSRGIHYRFYETDVMDETKGFSVFEKSTLEKYDAEKCLWSVSVSDFMIDQYRAVKDGVLIWGYTVRYASGEQSFAWLAKVSDSGKLLWEACLTHGFSFEYISDVLETENGYAVFSRGDTDTLVFSRYSMTGTEQTTCKNKIENEGIGSVARLGEDYILRLSNRSQGKERIVKLDKDGVLTDAFTYTANDCDYYVQDMVEFGGRMYLSTCAVPKTEFNAGGRHEIAGVLQTIFERDSMQITSEELIALLQQNYTAVLLVCDSSSGVPEAFFSVPACRGGKLTAGEHITWDVESFADAEFCPTVSAYSIRAVCEVSRYTLDGQGTLLSCQKTEELTGFFQ